jgi:hypothetical protein
MKATTLSKAKVPKWKTFMGKGESGRWKREGSVKSMLKLTKKVR